MSNMNLETDAMDPRPFLVIPAKETWPSVDWIASLLPKVRPIVVADGLAGDLTAPEAAGVRVVRHSVPLGLGRCVKTGLNEALLAGGAERGVLVILEATTPSATALDPLLRALTENPVSLTLGITPTEGLSPRMRRERVWSSRLYALLNGRALRDLRPPVIAVPGALVGRLAVLGGEGDSYGMDILLQSRTENIPLAETETDDFPRHAEPLAFTQWLRMGLTLLRFLASSLTSFLIDYGAFTVLYLFASKSVTVCTVAARIISSMVNYMLNRKLVFKSRDRALGTLVRYYLLVIALLVLNVLLLKLATQLLPLPVLVCKPLVEACVYGISYFLQRDVVFGKKENRED